MGDRNTKVRRADLYNQLSRVAAGDCPPILDLGKFIDGELPAHQMQALEVHLKSCPSCVNRLIDLRELALMDREASAPLSAFVDKIKRIFAAVQIPPAWISATGLAAAGIAAMVILAVKMGYIAQVGGNPESILARNAAGSTAQFVLSAFGTTGSGSDAFFRQVATALIALPGNSLPQVTRGDSDAEVYREAAPATVLIQADLGDSVNVGTGSIIDTEGRILTAAHVVQMARRVAVFFFPKAGREDQRQEQGFSATMIKDDPKSDLALLEVRNAPAKLPYLRVGSLTQARVGEKVYAISHSQDCDWSFTKGAISAIRTSFKWRDGKENTAHRATFIQTSAPLSPGNSGGPLLDARAELLAINTFTGPNPARTYGAVGVDTVRQFLRAPSNFGVPRRSVSLPQRNPMRRPETYGHLQGTYLKRDTPPPDVWLIYPNGQKQPAYGAEAGTGPARLDRVVIPADLRWQAFAVYIDVNCDGKVDLIAQHTRAGTVRYERPHESITLSSLAPAMARDFANSDFPYFRKLEFCR